MRLTISRKLGFGFGAMILTLLCLIGTGMYIKQVGSGGVAELEALSEQLDAAREIDAAVASMRTSANRFLAEATDHRAQELSAAIGRARAEAQAFAARPATQDIAELRDQLTATIEDYAKVTDELGVRLSTKVDVFYNQCGPAGLAMETALRDVAKVLTDALDMNAAAVAFSAVAEANLTRLGVARYLVTLDDKEFEKAAQGAVNLNAALAKLAKHENVVVRERTARAQKKVDAYVAIGGEVHKLMGEVISISRDRFDTAGPRLAAISGEIKNLLTERRRQTEAAASGAIAFAQTVMIVVGSFAMLFGAAVALLIGRSIARPIAQLSERLRDIAQGEADLTRRVDEGRRDELGEMAQYFNMFVKRIQSTLLEVASATDQVAATATQIAASSGEMARGMQEQSGQVGHIRVAVQEMTGSVAEVASKTAEAASRASASGQSAQHGGQVVTETISGMNSIRQAVTASAASVTQLGHRGEQIGEIIKVINDIADQTNLLALNAAIEAARAGEHGRGFAVVADEVRKLAERTQRSTQEVGARIREIQDETRVAVERMNGGTSQVEVGVQRAMQAGESLRTIVSSAQEVAGMIQSIAAAAEEQGAASEQISKRLEQISSVISESSVGVSETARAASELSSKAEQLRTQVGRFRLRDAAGPRSGTLAQAEPARA